MTTEPLLQIVMTPEEAAELTWQDQALCAQSDPEEWYPEPGDSVNRPKRICRQCPVRVECLAYAMDRDEPHGLWGGLSREERKDSAPAYARGTSLRVLIADADAAWDAVLAAHAERSRVTGRRYADAYWARVKASREPAPPPTPQPAKAVA